MGLRARRGDQGVDGDGVDRAGGKDHEVDKDGIAEYNNHSKVENREPGFSPQLN
jgi:hypothetical protein